MELSHPVWAQGKFIGYAWESTAEILSGRELHQDAGKLLGRRVRYAVQGFALEGQLPEQGRNGEIHIVLLILAVARQPCSAMYKPTTES